MTGSSNESSASPSTPSSSAKPDVGQFKTDARDSRLSIKTTSEEKYRKELAARARENCKPEMEAFTKCAKETGIAVVFKCRELNRAMNECIGKQTTDEAFDNFLREKGLNPENRIKKGIFYPFFK